MWSEKLPNGKVRFAERYVNPMTGKTPKVSITMDKERFYCGHRSELFMCDVNGDYLNYYSYNKYLRENAKLLFDKDVTTHFMRHTHVALMAEQGVPLDVISRRLGHSDSKITLNIYFHVTKKMREKDNQKIKEVSIL